MPPSVPTADRSTRGRRTAADSAPGPADWSKMGLIREAKGPTVTSSRSRRVAGGSGWPGASGPRAVRRRAGPGRLGVEADLVERRHRTGDDHLVVLLPVRDPRGDGVVRTRSRPAAGRSAGSARCAGRRAARRGPSSASGPSAAATGSARPAPRDPSRSPSAKCTWATSSGSVSSRLAISTMLRTAYAVGSTATCRGQLLRDVRATSSSRRAGTPRARGRSAVRGARRPPRRRPRRSTRPCPRSPAAAAVVDQPAGGPLDQGAHLEPHPGLHVGGDLVVVGVDLVDQLRRAEDLPRDEVRPHQLVDRAPVSSESRWKKVIPAPLTRSLTTCVVMISRRSGWLSICSR